MKSETITSEAVMDAYQKLPEADRRDVDKLAESLITGYRLRSGGGFKGLGVAGAVELLGCIGVFEVMSLEHSF